MPRSDGTPPIDMMMFNQFFKREEGQGLVEYALILVLVAIVVIAILLQLGPAINQAFCRVANVLKPGTCGTISIISAAPVDIGGAGVGPYQLHVTVQVAEAATVTVQIDGGGSGQASCSAQTNCLVVVDPAPSGGNFTVSAGSQGSITGSY